MEVVPLDILHHKKEQSLSTFPKVVDLNDAGVIELGECFRLIAETIDVGGIVDYGDRREKFYRDKSFQ